MSPSEELMKASGLVSEKRLISRGGKSFMTTVWVRPFDKAMEFMSIFLGITQDSAKERSEADYSGERIKKRFGLGLRDWKNHIQEYWARKASWDSRFSKKPASVTAPKSESVPTGDTAKAPSVPQWNLSAMRHIASIYGTKENYYAHNNRASAVSDTLNLDFGEADGHAGMDSDTTGDSEKRPGGNAELGDRSGERSSVRKLEQLGTDVLAATAMAETTVAKFSAKELKKRISDIMATLTVKTSPMTGTNLKTITIAEPVASDVKQTVLGYEGAGGQSEAGRSAEDVLSAFFTPQRLVAKMWDLAKQYVTKGSEVLEPSAGNGRFGNPDYKMDMIEFNPEVAAMAAVATQGADCTVMQGAFQELFMKGGRVVKKAYDGKKYDLVIGNPPYGEYRDKYRGFGEGADANRYEEYFIDRGLDVLKDGGTMVFVVPSGFLRGKANSAIKAKIAAKGKIIEAYRLPAGVFENTDVNTDILVIRKEPGNVEDFSDKFFENNPGAILGQETTRMTRWGKDGYIVLGDASAIDRIVPGPMKQETKAAISVAMKGNTNAARGQGVDIDTQMKAYADTIPEGSDGLRLYGLLTGDNVDARKIIDRVSMRPENARKVLERANALGLLDAGVYAEADKYLETFITGKKPVAKVVQSDNKEVIEESRKKRANGGLIAEYVQTQPNIETYTADDFVSTFTPEHDKATVDVWENTRWDGTIDPAYARKNFDAEQMCVQGSEFYHNINYASGNIPEKIKALESEKAQIVAKYGAQQYQRQMALLKVSLPKLKDIKSLKISILSTFVKNFFFGFDAKAGFHRWDEKSRTHIEVKNAIPTDMRAGMPMFVEQNTKDQYSLYDARHGIPILRSEAKSIDDFLKHVESVFSDSKEKPEEYIMRAAWYPTKIPLTLAYQNAQSLTTAFGNWAGVTTGGDFKGAVTPAMLEGITWNEIADYITGKPVRGYAKDPRRKEEVTEKRRRIAESLFESFIREGLTTEQDASLTQNYNERFNSHIEPDYSKIPLAIKGFSKTKGGKKYIPKKHQLTAVSFVINKGTGILAHGVGLGKTNEGIMATIYNMQLGRCKRPVFIVPNQVYEKWARDVRGHFPMVKINALKNLSGYSEQNLPVIEDGSVTIITESALQKLTFKDETLKELTSDITDVMADISKAADKKTDRELAQGQKKIEEKTAKGAKVTGQDFIYAESLGIDHITVDEAHHFKNVFGTPKLNRGKSAAQVNEYSSVAANSSDRGAKVFSLAQYIQKNNNDRNVFMLTATPFTNSPVEIYNMLSMVARKRLKNLGIYNLQEFLATFCKLQDEWTVTGGGVKKKTVIKEFNNVSALQALIREYIDFKTGNETDAKGNPLVKRPRKHTHAVRLKMNALQQAIMKKEESRYLKPDPDKPGEMLVALNNMRMATVSPKLHPDYENSSKVHFVKDSPKLEFVAKTAAQAYKENQTVGQVIYLPVGIKFHPDMAEYMATELGVPRDAIAIIGGEATDKVSGKRGKKWDIHVTDTTSDKFSEVKQQFNDQNGKVKIIIGSSKILEGVSLNANSSTIYNCFLDWNPTATEQLDGRIWRQGNAQTDTTHVIPLMADSVDSVMYQKHDEKSSRISSIMSYKDSETFEVPTIRPEEMKYDLIRDPDKRTDFRVGVESEAITNQIESQRAIKEDISQKFRVIKDSTVAAAEYENNVKDTKDSIQVYRNDLDKVKAEDPDGYYGSWSYKYAIENLNRTRSQLAEFEKARKSHLGRVEIAKLGLKRLGITEQNQESHIAAIDEKISALESRKQQISDNRAAILKEEIEKEKNRPTLDLPSIAAKKMSDIIASRVVKPQPLKKALFFVENVRIA